MEDALGKWCEDHLASAMRYLIALHDKENDSILYDYTCIIDLKLHST